MAEFLGKTGVWMLYSYGDGATVDALFEDPIDALIDQSMDGYKRVGFWPIGYGMSLTDAINWWERERNNYDGSSTETPSEDSTGEDAQRMRIDGWRGNWEDDNESVLLHREGDGWNGWGLWVYQTPEGHLRIHYSPKT